ncbi:hypothetical protein OMP38_14705 [Cohnella ginsengisoli]|uniref:Tetratricopeptide repeat protein n=1 Tax=Cohnella ginsengisoli TaxID=425004 RepID=A0A9X4KGX4_9BACL|nr:hypothetical protein [Cohnella ginsengisoli]MDG0791967.1 hypothetical protein [Cohnella ginsengisoli]
MRRILTTLFALVFVLTACGQNRFEKEMRSAKDNLLEGNYTEAKSSLEIALIEDPNNKDALALLEKAKQYILLEEKKEICSGFPKKHTKTLAKLLQN